MTVTTFLAVYGSMLSSVTLGWNFYRDYLDRPRVNVPASISRYGIGEDGRPFLSAPDLNIANTSSKPVLAITAANVGRRPVKLRGWGGKWKPSPTKSLVPDRPMFTVIPLGLPKVLDESDDHTELTDEVDIVDRAENMFVFDSAGRHWYLPDDELQNSVKT